MAKKPVVKSKSRVVTNAKKKSNISLNKQTALFGLVGILAFSCIAGIAWQKWQDHQLKAKALTYTNMTPLPGGNTVNGRACRENGTNTIHVIAAINSNQPGKVNVYVRGNGQARSLSGYTIDSRFSINGPYVVLLGHTINNNTTEYGAVSVSYLKLC